MKSEVNAIMTALVKTLNFPIESSILYQIPIFLTLCATGLRNAEIIFCASNRISNALLINANNGANGNAATNMVTNPN